MQRLVDPERSAGLLARSRSLRGRGATERGLSLRLVGDADLHAARGELHGETLREELAPRRILAGEHQHDALVRCGARAERAGEHKSHDESPKSHDVELVVRRANSVAVSRAGVESRRILGSNTALDREASSAKVGRMALTHSKGIALGTKAPPFRLPGTDDRTYDLDSFRDARALVVVFTCNHCPYAKAYETRFVDLVNDYRERGVALVAINPNDDRSHPDDSFDNMKARAKERGFNFPYLRDDTQEIARAYGAVCTPDIFVFDDERALRYAGRVDDSWRDPSGVKRTDLRDALDAILAKRAIDFAVTPAMGCSIKWR